MFTIWPMGCKKIESEDKLGKILLNDSYLGQEKIDGVRGVLQFLEDGQIVITTRGSTKANPTIPIDISHRLPHIVKYKVKSLAGTVIDGELYDTSKTSAELAGILNYRSTVPVPPTIHFRAFDMLYYKGTPFYYRDNLERIAALNALVTVLPEKMNIVSTPYVLGYKDKEELLYHLLARGMEGMVFKNVQSTYEFGTHLRPAKPHDTWYKYKKKDTVDVIITGSKKPDQYYVDPETREYNLNRTTKGWDNGWIGSIEFKFTKDGRHFDGYCSGITDELREMLSENHEIKSEYIGRVMEVEFMEKTSDGNLRHPRFVRLREEIEHEGR